MAHWAGSRRLPRRCRWSFSSILSAIGCIAHSTGKDSGCFTRFITARWNSCTAVIYGLRHLSACQRELEFRSIAICACQSTLSSLASHSGRRRTREKLRRALAAMGYSFRHLLHAGETADSVRRVGSGPNGFTRSNSLAVPKYSKVENSQPTSTARTLRSRMPKLRSRVVSETCLR